VHWSGSVDERDYRVVDETGRDSPRETLMSETHGGQEHHDNHGSTPAAWTAVTIIMVAFLIGGIGVWIAVEWLFWFAVALCVVGVIVGKVMQMMGLGAKESV
jgi:hypothetical protein